MYMDLADGDSIYIRDGIDITESILAQYMGEYKIEDTELQYGFVSSTGQYANIYFDSVSQYPARGFLISVKSGNQLYCILHQIDLSNLYMMWTSLGFFKGNYYS